MAYQAVMPTGIIYPISPGSVTWMCPVTEMPTGIVYPINSEAMTRMCPETEMPTGIIYPINPVMERSDLAGIQEAHTPHGRCRQASSIRLTRSWSAATWPGYRRHTPRMALPAGIVYPINPVMERSDLAGIQEAHTPDGVAGRHRLSD